MRSSSVSVGWTTRAALVLIVLLVAGAGITTAAVAGDFSSSYDGYNDDVDTDVRGHEIQVEGTLEFSGVDAVGPKIVVRPSEQTVLDYGSVELQQPAETSVNFDKAYLQRGVEFRAEEIPAGNTFELAFVVYPVAGLTQSEIKSAEVFVQYETPSGELRQKPIDVTTSLSHTPPNEITSLEGQISDLKESNSRANSGLFSPGVLGIPKIGVWAFAALGAIVVLLTVVMVVYNRVKEMGTGGSGPPS